MLPYMTGNTCISCIVNLIMQSNNSVSSSIFLSTIITMKSMINLYDNFYTSKNYYLETKDNTIILKNTVYILAYKCCSPWLVGRLPFFQLDSKGFVADPIFSRYQFYNVTSVKQSIVNLFNVKQNSPKNIKLDLMYVIHFLSVDVLLLLTALNSTNSRVLIFTVYGPDSFIKHSIQLVNSSKTI